MLPATPTRRDTRRAKRLSVRVGAQLRVPLVRNAYSLVGSTLANSVLGVVFWIAAARLFTPATVGIDAALISAMGFLSILAQVNLGNGFNRFVPTAGRLTGRLVRAGYALAIGLTLVAGLVFLAGVDLWASELAFLTRHPTEAAWFVLAAMIWTVFVLEDAVLVGLGEAHWVLVENIVYGVLKLLALVVVATALDRFGIFLAWTVPLIALVVPVNVFIFRRAVPRRAHEEPLEEIDARVVRRFVAPDFVASLMGTATTTLMPVVVLAISGPRDSAFMYLAWTIAYTLFLISLNVGMSLVTEAARSPEKLIEYTRKALLHGLGIVVPLALGLIVLAPVALSLFGSSYVRNATTLLRLFALSSIPGVVVATYVSVARARRHMRAVVTTVSLTSGSVIVLSVVLLSRIGLNGVGLAWVIAQSCAAAVILATELRPVWLSSGLRARRDSDHYR